MLEITKTKKKKKGKRKSGPAGIRTQVSCLIPHAHLELLEL